MAFPQSPKTCKACTMVTHAVTPCRAWDHILAATFLTLSRVFFVEPQALGRRCSTCSKCGTVCWLCLPAVPLWLCLHRESRCPGSSGWSQVAAERFKSLDCLLPEASGNSHTRETRLKTLTGSGLRTAAVDVFLIFCAKKRGRTEDISKAQYEKKSCSSGYKAAPSGRHRHTSGVLPSFLPPPQHGPERVGDGTRLPE